MYNITPTASHFMRKYYSIMKMEAETTNIAVIPPVMTPAFLYKDLQQKRDMRLIESFGNWQNTFSPQSDRDISLTPN